MKFYVRGLLQKQYYYQPYDYPILLENMIPKPGDTW